MTERFSRYDTADHLKTEEEIETYLQACADENDPALMVAALGDVARARNMMQLAKDVGLSRAGLYKALSGESNPSYATVLKVANALGYKFSVTHI
ncbi:putative addiction module antidote protein [Variovorax sp. J31P179]|jgi:probable addiction module antidote protein|uniref:addiction module antidote protein n=1 Tax=Variovorax sp. J31P179 TaxID=3053508 RepID=UPI002574FE41|nr:addiction module antidote protein [Variovorax sp. J31P179]MDM0082531.1 putative addiction module antidote protein [Variovorax sp. J31P179]